MKARKREPKVRRRHKQITRAKQIPEVESRKRNRKIIGHVLWNYKSIEAGKQKKKSRKELEVKNRIHKNLAAEIQHISKSPMQR